MRKLSLVFLLLGCSFNIYPQFFKNAFYFAEAEVNVGNGNFQPFWLTANKFGVPSTESNSGYARVALFRPLEGDKDFSYGWGVDLLGAVNNINAFYIQQLYFSISYKILGLEIGSIERFPELKNPYLSSGGLTLSNNAHPIPQIRVGIPNYWSVPYTNNWFHIKGHLAYGLFADNHFQRKFTDHGSVYSTPPIGTYVENAVYHSKALYGKIGNGKFPVSFEGGLEMVARFGGKCHLSDGSSFVAPARLKDFFRILIPLKGGGDSPIMDQQNVLGDHLGSWNFSLNYDAKNWDIRLYYEHQFNDHSMMFMEYPWKDGMWGVEVNLPQNRFVSTLLFERLDSRDQAGAIYHDSNELIPEQISAVDDYYNHGVYSGWQHGGMGIGNSLFISPAYNTDKKLMYRSNRLIAHHVGISGRPFSCLSYRALLSFAQHWGTYIQPFHEVMYNNNFLFEIKGYLPQKPSWVLTAGVGYDKSQLIGNNWGVNISLRKTGLLAK